MIEETQNWELMGEVYRHQAEALRQALAERDAKIAELNRKISELKEQNQ